MVDASTFESFVNDATPVAEISLPFIAAAARSFRMKGNSYRGQAIALIRAADFLDQHVAELSEFCSNPRSPENLVMFLLDVSERLDEEVFAKTLARCFLGRRHPVVDELSEALSRTLHELEHDDGHLADLFHHTLKHGLLAAFWRWPDDEVDAERLSLELAQEVGQEDFLIVAAACHDYAQDRAAEDSRLICA